MSEITLECKLARKHYMVNVPDVLAYLMISLTPDTTIDFGTLPLNIALVIDISNSMRGQKIKNAKEAAKLVVNYLKPVDTVSVTIFSDEARVIVPSTRVTDRLAIQSKIDRIGVVGGTRLYHGLEAASREMRRAASSEIHRIIVLTDGETEGEEQCKVIARQEAQNKISISSFGIGNEYNEDFLKDLSDIAVGSSYHVQDPWQIGSQFAEELNKISAAVVSDVKLSLNAIPDVKIDECYRLYPEVNRLIPDLDAGGQIASVAAGNLSKNDRTVFGVQMLLPPRPAGRVRIAQVFASYNVPSLRLEDKVEKSDVVVNFTDDGDLCGRTDPDVIGYFNQLNAQNLISRATRAARDGNVSAATVALNEALLLTRKSGNVPLTRNIESALQELRNTGTITPGLSKTIKAGSGHTVKIEDA